MVVKGMVWYNYYILIRFAATAMLPTTNAVFLQLIVLLFDYCILVLCISQTERRTDASSTSWLGSYVYTQPGGNVGLASHRSGLLGFPDHWRVARDRQASFWSAHAANRVRLQLIRCHWSRRMSCREFRGLAAWHRSRRSAWELCALCECLDFNKVRNTWRMIQ